MLQGKTQMSSVCAHLHHTGCKVNFGSGVRCQCTCHRQDVEIIKEPKKTRRITVFLERAPNGFSFGIIDQKGKQQWDTCIDMIELLCDAKIRFDMEVEEQPDGDIKGLRVIKPKRRK